MAVKLEVQVPAWALVYDKKKLKAALRKAGQEIAAFTRALIRRSKGSGAMHHGVKSSSPGQPPINRTGNLAGSIKVKVMRGGEGVSVRDMAAYALSLEGGAHGGGGDTSSGNIRLAGSRAFGRYGKTLGANRQKTKSKVRELLPRPYLSTVLEQHEASISERIRQAVVEDIQFVKQKVPKK